MVKIYIYNEMKKRNIPEEIFALITEEEINIFKELQIKIKELNNKTNLTRLTDGDDYWYLKFLTAFGHLKLSQILILIIKNF